MEGELNYVTTTFKKNDIVYVKPDDVTVIYETVQTGNTNTITAEKPDDVTEIYETVKNGNTNTITAARQHLWLCVVAIGLGIFCITLMTVGIVFSIHFTKVIFEKDRENSNLTAQNLQLMTEKANLARQTEELTREKDQLTWTIGVIMEYENFPVNTHCPQKVCKPCLDGWVLFQSHCYLFAESDYYYVWRSWDGSRTKCQQMMADLVVIESQEEQEFISNHTKYYNDEKHGYWIGLSNKNAIGTWTWIDGNNLTVVYWRTQKPGYTTSCALTLPQSDHLANWSRVSCDMRNRWICEAKALINSSAAV